MPAQCRGGALRSYCRRAPPSTYYECLHIAGWICGSWCAREPRPLRHRHGTLGCGAISGPQQQCCHAVDDVEDVLADVREVALGQRLDALHGVVHEPELPLHRELERVQNVC